MENDDQRRASELDLIWGAGAIAEELNIPVRRAYYLLEKGVIPGDKAGAIWVSSKSGLRKRFASALNEKD